MQFEELTEHIPILVTMYVRFELSTPANKKGKATKKKHERNKTTQPKETTNQKTTKQLK